METTSVEGQTKSVINKVNDSHKTEKDILKSLRPRGAEKTSNYNPRLPRKLIEALCETSTNTLMKLENDGLIKPIRLKRGGVENVTYGIEDVHNIFKYKNISFKNKEEAEIITVFSQKGGVGKSAFTQHLGSMLSLVGRVLVVDIDAQADATILYDLDTDFGDLIKEDDELPPSIQELMDWSLEGGEVAPYEKLEFDDVVKHISPKLDVIPSDLDLGEVNYSLNRLPLKPRYNKEGHPEPAEIHMIKEVFDKVKDRYDYIIVDCPPNIETCNVSALFAANRIIVPLELEAKSLSVMRRNVEFLEKLKDLHPGFNWDKILVVPNKFRRENIKIKALAALEDLYADSELVTLSEVVLPNSTIIDKCSDWRIPIFVPTSRFNSRSGSSIPQAKEFTNYFWAIMHEILDLPLERLLFETREGSGN